MPDYSLERTGLPPLAFTGELIASESSHAEGRRNWHELALYRTGKGKLVLHITYKTTWKNESERSTVEVCNVMPEVVTALREYDPTEWVTGPAVGALDWEQRRQEMRDAEVDRYDALVGRLLAKVPEATERLE